MQGRLSGQMKRNVGKLKEVVQTLVGNAEAVDDPLYLRMRNNEITRQLKELKEVCENNKRDLEEANRRIKEQQERDRTAEKNRKTMETGNGRSEVKEREKKKGTRRDKEMGREEDEREETGRERGLDRKMEWKDADGEEDMIWRLSLGGVSIPIPAPRFGDLSEIPVDKKEREKVLSRQIAELVRLRREVRKESGGGMDGKESRRKEGGRDMQEPMPITPKKQSPRIISDVQILVPPRGTRERGVEDKKRERKEETRKEEERWLIAGKEKKQGE